MAVDTEWLVDFFRRQARLGFDEGDYTRTRNSCKGILQQSPGDQEAWLLLGEAALASHDSATALRAFEKLLELEPKNPDYALKLAKTYLQVQDLPAAAAAFRQVLEQEPEHAEALNALNVIDQLQERLQVLGQLPVAQLGRNDPCFCGSGLKYKKCCLEKNTQQVLQQRCEQAFAAGDWQNVISLREEVAEPSVEMRRAEALARYQLGQRAPAYPLIRAARNTWPEDIELLAAQADLELDHDLARAESLAQAALAQDAKQWRASLVLAACHVRRQRPAEAEAVLRALVRNNPECDMAWQRLSSFLRNAQRLEDDLAAMDEWTQTCPGNADAWCQRGISAVNLNADPPLARAYFEQALVLNPQHHEAFCWLGLTYRNQQDPQTALGYLLRGLQIKPDYQPGWGMLGGVYHSVGRQHEAEGCFMRALAITPENALAWNNLANTYLDAHELEEAEKVMRVALQLNAKEPNLWNNLGNILGTGRRLKESREAYLKALEVAPDYKPVLANLAGVEANFGNFDKAIGLLRQVLSSPQARTNFLFFANYHPDWSGEQVFSVYREVVSGYFPKRQYFEYENERTTPRRLRIGYVSPDFCHHVCAHFIEPLMKHHDHSQVEVFAYSLVRREDKVTERFLGYADHWRHCVGLSDQAIAEQIRRDRVDILVDLAGHTGNNRLPLFALKPAPVQVSWWVGFAFGTGIKEVDYFLADEEMLPPGCESSFAESLWRMPAPAIVFQPNPSMPEITPLPAQTNGYITFGSLTRPVRVNYKVVRAWAELLKRVPNSRLILDSASFKDESLCDHYRKMFADCGVDTERLRIGYTSPVSKVLGEMDIALDCFPHNSGTTLFESLWMGLPFVSLRDRPSMGRVGALILRGQGRSEWIADTLEEYLDKLVKLASDVPALAVLRRSLREEMQASPLCDGADFARRMELTYRQMWQRYCEEGEAQ